MTGKHKLNSIGGGWAPVTAALKVTSTCYRHAAAVFVATIVSSFFLLVSIFALPFFHVLL